MLRTEKGLCSFSADHRNKGEFPWHERLSLGRLPNRSFLTQFDNLDVPVEVSGCFLGLVELLRGDIGRHIVTDRDKIFVSQGRSQVQPRMRLTKILVYDFEVYGVHHAKRP